MVLSDERVPVLIVGGGYAGLTSALFLAHHGVRPLLVDRHPGVSIQGRARGINQRSMEIYRPLGLEPAIHEAGRPFDHDAGVARCETLAGHWTWLFEQEAPRAWPDLSAGEFCMADQNTVEPLLIDAARTRGADLRFNTQMLSFDADAEGVSALIEDRASGQRRAIHADYLIAADGHRSPIREQLGIARQGRGVTQHWASIVADADLSEIVRQRAMFWIVMNPAIGVGAVTATATPGRWGMNVGYDPDKGSLADFTPDRCVEVVRAIAGRADLPVRIVDVAGWEEAVGVADRYRSGRVFLVGDSAHVWPPAGAMGANTAVQDAHNLAWKLATVLKGRAAPSLLDSYEAERRPVAVELARLTVRRQENRFGASPDQEDIDDKVCILGQRYHSAAIVDSAFETVFGERVERQARPGARIPHLWLERQGMRLSPHDLVHDAFVLFTDAAGTRWAEDAATVGDRLSVPLRSYRVGADGEDADLIDREGKWTTSSAVGTGGAVLVRPDGYVAWHSSARRDNPADALTGALRSLLGRPAS